VTERLLTARELSERFSVSVESILRWHRAGRLPGGFRLASRVLRWRESELDAWLEARREFASSGTDAHYAGHE
jgi:predicted DNA-binding transcriptional regulator AlpA